MLSMVFSRRRLSGAMVRDSQGLPKSSCWRHFGHGDWFGEGQAYDGARHASSVKHSLPFRKGGECSLPFVSRVNDTVDSKGDLGVGAQWLQSYRASRISPHFIFSSICGPQVQPTIVSSFESCNVVF